MTWQRTVLIIAILFAMVISWLGRYELVGVSAGGGEGVGSVYKLDRWTGEVIFIIGAGGGHVKIKQ